MGVPGGIWGSLGVCGTVGVCGRLWGPLAGCGVPGEVWGRGGPWQGVGVPGVCGDPWQGVGPCRWFPEGAGFSKGTLGGCGSPRDGDGGSASGSWQVWGGVGPWWGVGLFRGPPWGRGSLWGGAGGSGGCGCGVGWLLGARGLVQPASITRCSVSQNKLVERCERLQLQSAAIARHVDEVLPAKDQSVLVSPWGWSCLLPARHSRQGCSAPEGKCRDAAVEVECQGVPGILASFA